MQGQTLSQFLEDFSPSAALSDAISTLARTSVTIAETLRRGALGDVLGDADGENVQGEQQKKLDVIANDLLKQNLGACPAVRGIASEEEDEVLAGNADGELLVTYDPLDGSSNIDINSMVGTIFSILETESRGELSEQEFLQPGRQQRAAGYVLYGPSVMLALSLGQGHGVCMFTLNPDSGDYLLTAPHVRIEADTREFAINMSNQRFWAPPMQQYVADLLAGEDGPRGKNFNMRWVAAMVADVHRVLCRGGIFSYPWDSRDATKPGKLRLMYEANPLGFLVAEAGGEVWTHDEPILDLQPERIHQRVPVILGSANEVKTCVAYHREV